MFMGTDQEEICLHSEGHREKRNSVHLQIGE